jgi:hypothetical protein
MNRIRHDRRRTLRQWLGLCLALLLALAPPFNLAGVDLALTANAESGAHPGHGHEGHDHSGLAHHASGSACLQCLVMGGMSLAGAAPAADPTLQAHATTADWILATLAWDSRDARIVVCRGPPART